MLVVMEGNKRAICKCKGNEELHHTLTFIGAALCGTGPWLIVVKMQAFFTVRPGCEMLALTNKMIIEVLVSHHFTKATMTIAFAPEMWQWINKHNVNIYYIVFEMQRKHQ